MAFLIIAFSFALAGGIVGKIKGSSFFIWFLVSGLLPGIGLLARSTIGTPLAARCPDPQADQNGGSSSARKAAS